MNKRDNEQNLRDSILVSPVAYIRSCFTDRFGIPRQSGLVPSARASIVFSNSNSNKLSLRGLDEFSHLWVIFYFHRQSYKNAGPLVKPPRLGGNKNIGVFATRSPNRPNPVGMSAVALDSIEQTGSEILVHITGGDFLDGTPVIDLKPYVSHVDSLPRSKAGWASGAEEVLPVDWSKQAQHSLDNHQTNIDTAYLKTLIEETLAQDPRPAYERKKDGKPGQQWHMQIAGVEVSWEVLNDTAVITALKAVCEADQ